MARGLEDESYRRWLEHRDTLPAGRPRGAAPVAVVSRLFPLLEPDG